MPSLTDIWGNTVEITPSYVSHRNRLIDVYLIHTFQTKGKRLLINTFKQNVTVPTMCVFFDNKEKAEEAYQMMKQVYYPTEQKALVTQDSDIRSDMAYAFMVALMALPIVLAIVATYK